MGLCGFTKVSCLLIEEDNVDIDVADAHEVVDDEDDADCDVANDQRLLDVDDVVDDDGR